MKISPSLLLTRSSNSSLLVPLPARLLYPAHGMLGANYEPVKGGYRARFTSRGGYRKGRRRGWMGIGKVVHGIVKGRVGGMVGC
eukprot:757849-Hanusia_phi.AAC.1